jgi:nucleoid DNA-binding protein
MATKKKVTKAAPKAKAKAKAKPAAKAKAKPAAKKAGPLQPVKSALTKSALISRIAEDNGITRAQAAGAFASIEAAILGSVHPKGVGTFMLPGLMKVSLRKVPARKAGTLVRNPGTGEMMKAAAKPASVRVKIRALAKLKAAAAS